MTNTQKQAHEILNKWYGMVCYSEDNTDVTDQESFKELLENIQFSDKDLVKEINKLGQNFLIDNNIRLLDFVTAELQSDRDLVLELVKLNGHNLELVKEEFLDDKELILAAVASSSMVFNFVSDRLKDDDDVVNLALKHSPMQIQYTSDRFKNDKELILKLIKRDPTIISSISTEFKNDIDVVLASWLKMKESLFYDNFRLTRSVRILLEGIGDDIKPFFSKVNTDFDNVNLIKQMDASFNYMIVSKEVGSSVDKPVKKAKI